MFKPSITSSGSTTEGWGGTGVGGAGLESSSWAISWPRYASTITLIKVPWSASSELVCLSVRRVFRIDHTAPTAASPAIGSGF